MSMQGKYGSLHYGRFQIGGLLDWRLELTLHDSEKDNARIYKLSQWKISSMGYWLFEPTNNDIILHLYSGKAYWKGKGHIITHFKNIFDTLIHEPLEIIGKGILEGCELIPKP